MGKIVKNAVKMEEKVFGHFWLAFKGGQEGRIYLEMERGDGTSFYGWSKKVYSLEEVEALDILIVDNFEEVFWIIMQIFPLHPDHAQEKFENAKETFQK